MTVQFKITTISAFISAASRLQLTHIFYCSHVRFVPGLDLYHEVVFHVLVLKSKKTMMDNDKFKHEYDIDTKNI